MLRTPTYLRAALVAGAALVMAAVSAAPAAAQSVSDPFEAQFRDQCALITTEGTLTWPDPLGSNRLPVVAVQGTISDVSVCADDGRRSFAEFTAYVGNRQVDYRQEYVNPNSWSPQPSATSSFRFRMVDGEAGELITRIEIRACRDFGPWLPAFQCGTTQVYWGPSHIPPPQPPAPPIQVPAAS